MSKAKKKVIPAPVDVVGRRVCWKPTPTSDILYGEVLSVYLTHAQCPKYEHGRILKKTIKVIIPDGRVFTMSGEHEHLKKIGMAAMEENTED